MMMQDKVVVITGGARGIGFAVAERFAAEGARVVLWDMVADQVTAAAAKLPGNAVGMAVNVTDPTMVEEAVKQVVDTCGTIDVLINNAGVTRDGLMLRMKESDWDLVINVNLKGAFNCLQKVSRHMLSKRSGIIINMASVIGLMGNAGQANYAASKGGLIALTKSAAKEMASRGIRVNAVAPGFIQTEMTAQLSEDVVASYAKAIPMARMGLPKDVADCCLFLAGDLSAYITGQVIQVDGGLLM